MTTRLRSYVDHVVWTYLCAVCGHEESLPPDVAPVGWQFPDDPLEGSICAHCSGNVIPFEGCDDPWDEQYLTHFPEELYSDLDDDDESDL